MGYCNCTNRYFYYPISVIEKFAWGPLKEVMDKRERDINKDIDDAEQAKLNAQKLEEENKQTLKETQDEVQRILEDAKVQARKQHEEIIHEANVRANGMIETAQSEINSQKNVQLQILIIKYQNYLYLLLLKFLEKKFQSKIKKN